MVTKKNIDKQAMSCKNYLSNVQSSFRNWSPYGQ